MSVSAYDELVKRLRNRRICIQQLGTLNDYPLLREAADAIEELQKLNWELLFRCSQAEALIEYYQTGKLQSNEPPKEET